MDGKKKKEKKKVFKFFIEGKGGEKEESNNIRRRIDGNFAERPIQYLALFSTPSIFGKVHCHRHCDWLFIHKIKLSPIKMCRNYSGNKKNTMIIPLYNK